MPRSFGVRCWKCHETQVYVRDTYVNSRGTVVRRRRVCVACGFRWTTYEIPAVRFAKLVSAEQLESVKDVAGQ